MGTIRYGAEQAVRNCAQLQPGESVVIITDQATEHIASELRAVAEAISPGNVTTFVMEDLGDRPDDGSNPLQFPDQVASTLHQTDVSFFAATGKKGELSSFRWPLYRLVVASSTLRHGHMPDISDQIMRMGMCADYTEIQRISARVGEIVREATRITVTTPAGTELTAEFSPSYKWVISDGELTPGKLRNLPDGEVFTCPYSITEGVIVVDGVLGDFFSEKYGLLHDSPVTLQIQDGRVRKILCDDHVLLAELEQYVAQDENADRIGEFAIGTNTGVDRLIGNMLQDEKFPGIHIAVGHPYPELTGVDWRSNAHVDAVLRNVTIDVEGYVIMKDGRFTF